MSFHYQRTNLVHHQQKPLRKKLIDPVLLGLVLLSKRRPAGPLPNETGSFKVVGRFWSLRL